MPTRIDDRRRPQEGRGAALVTFVMAGDPDLATSLDILRRPAPARTSSRSACFTDPMADGPAIQAAGCGAQGGTTPKKT
jgi:tryptophan synthase alpha chain